MSYSARLRDKAASMWEREKQHPFVLGIGDGTLPLDNFRYYMRQDYIFLVDFCRVIALAVAKASRLDDMAWFARLLDETLNKEMSLHVSFCQDFGITEDQLKGTLPSPTTHAYTRHMLETAYSGGVGEIAAVILPCSWGYAEIGRMPRGRRHAHGAATVLPVDQDVQLCRVQQAGRLAAVVPGPDSGCRRRRGAATDGGGLPDQQPLRVYVLGRRVPHGTMANVTATGGSNEAGCEGGR